MTESDKKSAPRIDLIGRIFAGAGLGLLLGLIVGLSKTPVVAGVVGTLTGLLAVFLGLQARDSSLPVVGGVKVDGLRIGSFGFATSMGLILGMFIRVTNPFELSPEEQYTRWLTAFGEGNENLARQAMVYERLSLLSKTWEFAPGEASEVDRTEGVRRQGASLVGKASTTSYCKDLEPINDDIEETLRRYENQNDKTLTQMANAVREISNDSQQLAVLRAYTAQFCMN